MAWRDELARYLLTEGERVAWMLWMEVIVFAMLELGGEILERFGSGVGGILLGELAEETKGRHGFCHLLELSVSFREREWTNALQGIAAPPLLSPHPCSPSNPALEREEADLEPVTAFGAVELLSYLRFYSHLASS